MGRPHLEFIQSQQQAWRPAPPALGAGISWKVLSRDGETGAVTALLLFAAETAADPVALSCDVEAFVLSGKLRLGQSTYAKHDYGFLPAGTPLGPEVDGGAVVLAFFESEPRVTRAATPPPAGALGPLRTIEQPWDRVNVDPNISHLQVARKNLRLSPDGLRRTYLLGAMPHGFPHTGRARKERHPHTEEFFVISGEIACSLCGTMRAGGYFWRPPGLWHGLDSTYAGFLLFCRTPGTNVTISEWSADTFAIEPDPPYRPVLPPALATDHLEPQPAELY